jgi:hypothetical protein
MPGGRRRIDHSDDRDPQFSRKHVPPPDDDVQLRSIDDIQCQTVTSECGAGAALPVVLKLQVTRLEEVTSESSVDSTPATCTVPASVNE